MSNVIIIGSGPAGISAALYTARAGVETLVIGGGAGALAKADKIENYYGFAEPVAAKDLLAAGIAQAKHAGAEVIEDEVVGIGFGSKLLVSTRSREYEADYVVLATGAYSYSMSSSYNRIPKPAVVLVNGEDARVIVKRETMEDIVRNDL